MQLLPCLTVEMGETGGSEWDGLRNRPSLCIVGGKRPLGPTRDLSRIRMTLTISDLLAYASHQARIEAADYFDPHYPRADEVRAWRNDRGHRDRDRRRVFRTFPGRIRSNAPLIPGTYGVARRLAISADAIDYTACHYAAREIWPAVFDYLQQTTEA